MTKNAYYKTGHARIGSVVSMRHRFQQFLNEPYDIVHPNQHFGYVNAKYRPCLIIGITEKTVIVAPIKSLKHQPRWLEVENGGFILSDATINKVRLASNNGGMAIGCAELREINIQDFTYHRIIGTLPPATFKAYIKMLRDYEVTRLTSTHPLQNQFDEGRPTDLSFCNKTKTWVKWCPPEKSRRIHKRDLLNQLNAARATFDKKYKGVPNCKLSESEQRCRNALRLKIERLDRAQSQHISNHKYELREHILAIQHGYGNQRDQVRHHAYSKRK